MLTITPAFVVSLLPLPFLFYLNCEVFLLLLRVRKEARNKVIRYPMIYHQGRVLGVASGGLALLPALIEWRIFVLNPLWSILYIICGVLGILGLRMAKRGLIVELDRLQRKKAPLRHK